MSLLQNLINKALEKNCLEECYTSISGRFTDCPIDLYGKNYLKLATYITIRVSKNRFATWCFEGYNSSNGVNFSTYGKFSTYNQINGATQKTIKKEIKVLEKLEIDIYKQL